MSWVGEACALSVSQQLKIPGIDVVSRDAKVRLLEDLDLPPNTALSRASMIGMARRANADYLVAGWYEGSTQSLRLNIQALRLGTMKLLAPIVADGPLEALPQIENHLAFEVLSQAGLNQIYPRTKYQERIRTIPNQAFSSYIYALLVKGRAGKVKLLRTALDATDDFPDARLMLSRLYYHEGDCEAALRMWSDSRREFAMPPEVQFMQGTCSLRNAQLEDAVEAYQAVLRQTEAVEIVNNLGVARVRQGDIALGIQHLLAAYERSPEGLIAKNLAIVRYLEGSYAAALSLLNSIMGEDAANGEMYYLRSVVQMASGNLQAAQEDSVKAVELGFQFDGQKLEDFLAVVLDWRDATPSVPHE